MVDEVAIDRQDVNRPPLSVEALLRGAIRRPADKRSEVGQPMDNLNVRLEVWCEVPRGTDERDHVASGRYAAPVVDVHAVRRRRREIASTECDKSLRDNCPRARVACRFPGEIPVVEFLESGVDAVWIEADGLPHEVILTDLHDRQGLPDDRLVGLIDVADA